MQELHQKLPLLLEYGEILIDDAVRFENMLMFVVVDLLTILIECTN